MPSALAIRHVAFEDLGVLEGLLQRRGFTVSTLDAGVDDLLSEDAAAADLLIVLGGPIGVHDESRYPFLVDEIQMIERRLASGRALLGICLGAQLIARAAGTRVYPGPLKEIGYAPLMLSPAGHSSALQHLAAAQYNVLHWHGDTFDLPDGAVCLASTEITQNQAFQLGDTVLALQFHLEADPRRFEQWLIGHAVELAQADVSVNELRTAAARIGATVGSAGTAVFGSWLDEIQLRPIT